MECLIAKKELTGIWSQRIGRYYTGNYGTMRYLQDGSFVKGITHYMPLPQPPGEV